VSWANLKQQFGDEYNDNKDGRRNFRIEFQRVLQTVKQLYPTARVQDCLEKRGISTGLILLTSPRPLQRVEHHAVRLDETRCSQCQQNARQD
jgi:hypothetical protein